MATMDVFNSNPFGLVELSTFVQQMTYKPQLITSSGLYEIRPIRTRLAAIEEFKGTISLLPFVERGGAASTQDVIKGAVRAFQTKRIRANDTIWASEVAGVRAYGTESEFRQVQDLVGMRFKRLRDSLSLTQEYHLLNGLTGYLKDESGNTLIDFATEFGVSRASDVSLDIDNASPKKGALRKLLADTRIAIELALGDIGGNVFDIDVFCAPDLYTKIVNHPETRDAYLATAMAIDLLGKVPDSFSFEGFTFHRYRAGSGVAVASGKGYVVPRGVPGLFTLHYSPMENIEFVNTPGQEVYARLITDMERQEFVVAEVESLLLPVCSRPNALRVFTA